MKQQVIPLLDEDSRHWQRLSLLATALARRTLEMLPLQRATSTASPLIARAPATRAVLAALPNPSKHNALPARRLLLPATTSDTQSFALQRAMLVHAAAHLRHSPAAQDSTRLKPMGLAIVSAIEDARVDLLICRDHPGVQPWLHSALAARPDDLDLTFSAFMARLDRILLLPNSQDGNHWVNKARELFEHAAQEHGLEDYDAFRALASLLANDLGQMRVRMDPQHYAVPSPYRDDNSYLWQHPESETTEESLVLPENSTAPPPPASEKQPNIEPQPDMELARYHYPEWDRHSQRLKADWCTLIDRLPAWQGVMTEAPANKPSPRQRLTLLRLPQVRQLDRRNRLRRQWEGDDLDLNAAVEVLVDRRLGLRPDPRLFMRPGKGPKPASLLILLDVSESVNDPAADGSRLLDMEKQAALLLVESRVQGVDRLAIHAFSSNTRAEVNYYRLLDFGQRWNPVAAAMLHALPGRYSTRMGAALRHASRLLQSEPEGQRTLLLITDGAPSDIDVHDSRYLIEDARQAVQQARLMDVRLTCLAVDGKADAWVQHIFGWRNFSIAEQSGQLPQRLTQMSARLASGR
ncbi:hypothetical protein AXE65_05285 [Ventosimonas gracilis]|uniref:VWFA domain-containing protein n=1 Tax=Ventosimonas gracilis TaxID=1680762 RepID=A0A139SPC3_9GAMM|nr:VWA domain-containing protein [Ventosimonas gracilis]KXU36301.1 hypothetical protein AXE65_05285 [Ventosimonas gracilis]